MREWLMKQLDEKLTPNIMRDAMRQTVILLTSSTFHFDQHHSKKKKKQLENTKQNNSQWWRWNGPPTEELLLSFIMKTRVRSIKSKWRFHKTLLRMTHKSLRMYIVYIQRRRRIDIESTYTQPKLYTEKCFRFHKMVSSFSGYIHQFECRAAKAN